jgi:hypothetical protein
MKETKEVSKKELPRDKQAIQQQHTFAPGKVSSQLIPSETRQPLHCMLHLWKHLVCQVSAYRNGLTH